MSPAAQGIVGSTSQETAFKAYLTPGRGSERLLVIKRFHLDLSGSNRFDRLAWKIGHVFNLDQGSFKISWRDEENDIVDIDGEEDLTEALDGMADQPLKKLVVTKTMSNVKKNEAIKELMKAFCL